MISKDVDTPALQEDVETRVNDAGTCKESVARLTQGCSPAVRSGPKPPERKKRKLLAKRWKRLVDGKIYFAQAGDAIKIGFSTDTDGRIATLQTAHFETLTVLAVIDGTQQDERKLHRRFHHLRIRGEWFRVGHDLVAHIANINDKPVPEPIARKAKHKASLSPKQAKVLTAVRGQVRRLPDGVQMERASLLAAQLENGVPAPYLARQVEIMAGHSQH